MLKRSPFWKHTALPLCLGLLALAGCGKEQSSDQAQLPSAPTPAPTPEATPVPKSATPNSFYEVTSQLDPGGDFYIYLSTAQWLAKLSHGLDMVRAATASMTPAEPAASASPSATGTDQVAMAPPRKLQGFELLKDIVDKSGLEQISGIGASSFAVAPGIHRNKLFIHHYPDNGSGILWSITGGQPHSLPGLDFLPADTGIASIGDFDLAQLLNFLRGEAEQSDIAPLKEEIDQVQAQFAAVMGVPLNDFLASLTGTIGMVVTLDATGTVTIPVQDRTETISTPRLAILLSVKDDLIFRHIDNMIKGNPGVIKTQAPGLDMRTMPFPYIPGLNLRPSMALWNGYLIFASDDKLINDMLAVKNGAPGFKSTPEYATLSPGLPDQGNSIWVISEAFARLARKLQTEAALNSPNMNPNQAMIMRQWLTRYRKVASTVSVGVHLPNGWLSVAQSKFTSTDQ
jgi:hypothetical protein